MQSPGEIPMKVLMTKGFLATRSHASKPCLSIRELAGTRCTSMPVMPGDTDRRNCGQNFFSFTYFHGLSATRPLGWPLRMTNGKVSLMPFGSWALPTKKESRCTSQSTQVPLDPQRPAKKIGPGDTYRHALSRPRRVACRPATERIARSILPFSSCGV
jgi:hypothetical protein